MLCNRQELTRKSSASYAHTIRLCQVSNICILESSWLGWVSLKRRDCSTKLAPLQLNPETLASLAQCGLAE